MVRTLETDLSTLRARPTTAPGSKPETSDVEVPASGSAATESPATNTPASKIPASDTPASEPSALKPAAAPAQTNAPTTPAPEGARGDAAPEARSVSPEPSAARQSSTAEPVSAETSEVDVRTLFEQSSAKETNGGPEPTSPTSARAASA